MTTTQTTPVSTEADVELIRCAEIAMGHDLTLRDGMWAGGWLVAPRPGGSWVAVKTK